MVSGSIEVGAARAAELASAGALLVDVREPHEHEAGHIAGSRHIPLGRLVAAAPTIDRSQPVVFYCRVGGRSLMAADAFHTAGYEAYSLAGGLIAWVDAGLALEPADGVVAAH